MKLIYMKNATKNIRSFDSLENFGNSSMLAPCFNYGNNACIVVVGDDSYDDSEIISSWLSRMVDAYSYRTTIQSAKIIIVCNSANSRFANTVDDISQRYQFLTKTISSDSQQNDSNDDNLAKRNDFVARYASKWNGSALIFWDGENERVKKTIKQLAVKDIPINIITC